MKTLRLLPSAVVLLLILTASALHAQRIPNPSFEAETFTVYPGYASQNGGITGWTFTSGVGLNPASSSFFANNGMVPQGTNVAFIYSTGSLETLGTTITGLTPGTAYTVRFRANSRVNSQQGAPLPGSSWTLNGGAQVPFVVTPAGNAANGYAFVSGTFTATAVTAALTIHNQSGTDTALLVDDFSIVPAPPAAAAWSFSPWTGDATSGISPQTEWARLFGSSVDAAINGRSVFGVDGPNPVVAGWFAITGVPNVYIDDQNNLTDAGGTGSAGMANNFIWGGSPATITLYGLTPGQTYVASLFSVGWDPAIQRRVTFSSGGQESAVDQNLYGDNNGLRVDYHFVADAATRIITITPQVPGYTFHLYGMALNRPILVTNTANAGAGSLRQAFATASAQAGPDFISFAPALSGQIITLNTEITVEDSASVTVDATTLPGGITLGGSSLLRHFFFGSYSQTSLTDVVLRGLTLTGGGSSGASLSGGAIFNFGKLTLAHCTFSGNSSGEVAGAVCNNRGTLTVTDCTFSGNSTWGRGGAIFNDGNAALTRCTFSGNSVTDYGEGGAIFHFYGLLTLDQCTLFGNSAFTKVASGGTGGAIFGSTINGVDGHVKLTHCTLTGNFATRSGGAISFNNNLGALTLTNSIVAANTSASGADIQFRGSLIRAGGNVIQSVVNTGTGSASGPAAITADPLLAPLANYGGHTRTMALRPGSPARNAAGSSAIISDQRGFPLLGLPDIGAYESGTYTNCAAFLAENLSSAVSAERVGPAGDYDSDGCTNEQEWNALTNPTNAASFLRILSAVRSGANLTITFPTLTGRDYTLWRAASLTGAWSNTGLTPATGNGANQSFTIAAPVAGTPRRFYRVQTGP